MPTADTIRNALSAHRETIAQLDAMIPEIERLAQMMRDTLERGGKILWMGNGGSAADSQHLAAEFVGRYKKDRKGLPSIALTTDTSILTSVGNDYGYDYVFARQVEALCTDKDLVVGISTSGNSPNVIHAIEAAKNIGAVTIGWTGEGKGKLCLMCDMVLSAPSKVTARIQEAHILIGHILCEIVDDYYAENS